MKVGDNVAYMLSRYDKFYGKDGISSRGVSEYREKDMELLFRWLSMIIK